MSSKKTVKRLSALILSSMLLFLAACGNTESSSSSSLSESTSASSSISESSQSSETSQTTSSSSSTSEVIEEKGEGKTTFMFTVTGIDGKESKYKIHTDEKTVGAALLKLNMIAGDTGEFGLFVKSVNGVPLDFNKYGKFWAFYVNGESSKTGVDSTNIVEGDTYSFKPAS